MNQATGLNVISLFESFAPKSLAVEGDPIGLQVGRLDKPVSKVLIALDVLEEVVDEAIAIGAELIIAHHPLIFRPLTSIRTQQPSGKLIEKLIKHDIAVYAAHTNLDVANGGVNDLLAEALKLEHTKILSKTDQSFYKKLVVYTPQSHADKIKSVLAENGAGIIGDYTNVSFSTNGKGQFKPENDAQPFSGNAGELTVVNEEKIEVQFLAENQSKIVDALLHEHPYEEVVYEISATENVCETYGLGRIGTLETEMTLEQFAQHVKQVLEVPMLRVVGDLQATVKKVAVLGGDGNKYFKEAKYEGADVFVTGDFYYHNAHDALALNLNVVDPGHNIEKIMKTGVAKKLKQLTEAQSLTVSYIASTVHTEPFQFM